MHVMMICTGMLERFSFNPVMIMQETEHTQRKEETETLIGLTTHTEPNQ